jgi:hypothetical protein
LAGGGGGGKGSSNGIPFMIQGTTSNPQVIPDVGGMATSAIKGGVVPGSKGSTASAATGLVGGLLGKKKSPQ